MQEITLTFHIEQDDPFAFREALPNVCIMGGLTPMEKDDSYPLAA